MADSPAVQEDLRKLVETLSTTGTSMRTWIRALRVSKEPTDGELARQLERACRHLDNCVRGLRKPATPSPAKAPGDKAVPALSGSTSAVPVTSLVGFLAEVDASGVLRIYGQDETYVLQFENGYLIYAHGDNPPQGELLGELLVKKDVISRADLLRVLERGRRENETLGGLLVREGCITQADLTSALKDQIQALGNRLFSQENARFQYYPGEKVIQREDVRLNVVGLLLESARQHDEAVYNADGWTPPPASQELDPNVLANLGSEIEAQLSDGLLEGFAQGQGGELELELGSLSSDGGGAGSAKQEPKKELELRVKPRLDSDGKRRYF